MIGHRGALRLDDAFYRHAGFRRELLQQRLVSVTTGAGNLKVSHARAQIRQLNMLHVADRQIVTGTRAQLRPFNIVGTNFSPLWAHTLNSMDSYAEPGGRPARPRTRK